MKYLFISCLIATLAFHLVTCRPIPQEGRKRKSKENAPNSSKRAKTNLVDEDAILKAKENLPSECQRYDFYDTAHFTLSDNKCGRMFPGIALESRLPVEGIYQLIHKESNSQFEASLRTDLFSRLLEVHRHLPGSVKRRKYSKHQFTFNRANDLNLLYVIAAWKPNSELFAEMERGNEQASKEGRSFDIRDILTELRFARLISSIVYAGSGEYLRVWDHFQNARDNIAGQLSRIFKFQTSSQSIHIAKMELEGEEMLVMAIHSEKTKAAINLIEFAFVEYVKDATLNTVSANANFKIIEKEFAPRIFQWKQIGFLASYVVEELVRYLPSMRYLKVDVRTFHPRTLPANAPKDYIWNQVDGLTMFKVMNIASGITATSFVPCHVVDFGSFDLHQRLRLTFIFETIVDRIWQYSPELARAKREIMQPELARLRDKSYKETYDNKTLCQLIFHLYKLVFRCLSRVQGSAVEESLTLMAKMALSEFDLQMLNLFYRDNDDMFMVKREPRLPRIPIKELQVPATFLTLHAPTPIGKTNAAAKISRYALVSSALASSNDFLDPSIGSLDSAEFLQLRRSQRQCYFCTKRFILSKPQAFNDHVEQHTSLTRYYDDLCRLDFSTTTHLKRHFNTPRHIAQSWAHGVPVNRIPPKLYTGKYGCKACPYRSNQKWGVYQHAKRIHIKARFDETGPIDAKSYLIEYPDESTCDASSWKQDGQLEEATPPQWCDTDPSTSDEIESCDIEQPATWGEEEEEEEAPIDTMDIEQEQQLPVAEDHQVNCDVCHNYPTDRFFDLFKHITSEHPEEYSRVQSIDALIDDQAFSNEVNARVGAYRCNHPDCPKSYMSASSFQYHARQHYEYAIKIAKMEQEVADGLRPFVSYTEFYSRCTPSNKRRQKKENKYMCKADGCNFTHASAARVTAHAIQKHGKCFLATRQITGIIEEAMYRKAKVTKANGQTGTNCQLYINGILYSKWKYQNEQNRQIVELFESEFVGRNPKFSK